MLFQREAAVCTLMDLRLIEDIRQELRMEDIVTRVEKYHKGSRMKSVCILTVHHIAWNTTPESEESEDALVNDGN